MTCRDHPRTCGISIHALHEESDYDMMETQHAMFISIHALHEESDLGTKKHAQHNQHFNPRSP